MPEYPAIAVLQMTDKVTSRRMEFALVHGQYIAIQYVMLRYLRKEVLSTSALKSTIGVKHENRDGVSVDSRDDLV